MSNRQFQPPSNNEIELSIWGAGYGEAIVLHVGGGKWIIVDSCIDPDSKLPISLAYLKNLKFQVDKDVRLLVSTHWHDDHIKGISTVLDKCKSADIVISSALRKDEFLKLISLYRDKTLQKASGIDEFIRIFQLLKKREQSKAQLYPPKYAIADRLLYRDKIRIKSDEHETKVYSLSPSDASVQKAILEFETLLPKEFERKRSIISFTPNNSSVVLWVEIGNEKILLGADLECTSDSNTGWSAILSGSTVISGKGKVYKIPHHGSENAHNNEVWADLLIKDPIVVATPFRRGRKSLPCSDDIDRIINLTPYAYITALIKHKKQKWTNRVVSDFVKQSTNYMLSAKYLWGQIRLRKIINDTNSPWNIELFGDSTSLN